MSAYWMLTGGVLLHYLCGQNQREKCCCKYHKIHFSTAVWPQREFHCTNKAHFVCTTAQLPTWFQDDSLNGDRISITSISDHAECLISPAITRFAIGLFYSNPDDGWEKVMLLVHSLTYVHKSWQYHRNVPIFGLYQKFQNTLANVCWAKLWWNTFEYLFVHIGYY